MNGDERTPRRTLAGTAALTAASLLSAAALALSSLAGAAPAGTGGTDPAPASPAVEEWYHEGLPDEDWLWDDDAFDDGVEHWPAVPDGETSPFAATTADDPLNFVHQVFPAV